MRTIILLIYFASALGASAATLIHEYTFDDGTVSDSAGSLNGSLFGGASISGGVLQLDGINDYAELGGFAVPTVGDFSVVLVAQQLSDQTGGFVEMISQGQTGGNGFYIGHDPGGLVRIGDQFLESGNLGFPTVPYPTDGAFHNWTMTSSAVNGTKLFLDGTLVYSNAAAANLISTGTKTRFGRQFDCCAEFFHGNIDLVQIYDGEIDPSDRTSVIPLPTPAPLLAGALVLMAGFRRLHKL